MKFSSFGFVPNSAPSPVPAPTANCECRYFSNDSLTQTGTVEFTNCGGYRETMTLAPATMAIRCVYVLNSIVTTPGFINSFQGPFGYVSCTISSTCNVANITKMTDVSGYNSSALACAAAYTNTKYYVGTIGNGTVLYFQYTFASVFDGNNKWYKFDNNYVGQVNSSGVISNYTSC